jgi:glycosyltransferase involved in cell wall biosynthesis
VARARSREGASREDPLMRTVLHLLPHPGGGAETYIDVLEGLDGYRHERVPFSTTRSRRRGVASLIARWPGIARRARAADVVHAHGDIAAILAAPLLRGRPSMITPQGLHRLRRVGGAGAWPVRRSLRAAVGAASRTACSARAERDDLAEILPPRLHGRLVVVLNGVPLPPPVDPARRGRAREALGLGDGDVAALYVGRLEARKDPFVAIDAVETARAKGAPVVLLIAGTGPLEPQVSARAGEAVRPLGHRDDVDELYAAADLFVLPSRREGMSFALLEAMSHALVPVVSDGPGNAEAVGEADGVFPAGDEDALSDRLARLATDAATRERLGAAARERIAQELSAEHFLARMRELYEAVVRERSQASTQGA